MTKRSSLSRRKFLGTSAALTGLALAAPQIARAAGYPERNIEVIIPTREGGGADRNFRAITSIWKDKLGTDFEPGFFPGASGRVGYEVYMGKNAPDAYSLIFGNMGPEVLNWAMQAPTFDIDDYFYFGRVDTDPACLFVGAESPLQTLDDVIAAGKTRRLNVGTSRMAHPASIGLLSLGEVTGADFNLIPLSGGKNTVAGAVTGEVDFSVLTSGSAIAAGESVRTLLVFGENRVGARLNDAPSFNDVYYGTDLPEMLSARAFGIHKKAADDHPDRMQILQDTFKAAFDDPALMDAYIATKGTPEYLNYGGIEECAAFKSAMLELGAKYKTLLTGA